jgi:hypothetical protein
MIRKEQVDSMTKYNPMREISGPAGYRKGDVFILFGELFGRGYANGLVEEARLSGMNIIGITVGRRDSDGNLRPLTADELTESEALLGGKIINIPLEAGFDMDRGASGIAPVDQLKGIKSDGWEGAALDWDAVEQSIKAGADRFTGNLAKVMDDLEVLIPEGANVLFSHIMAGGIPRARILMPVLNRVFKGQGERFTSSEVFWKTPLGNLCKLCFEEVTANTFKYLIEASEKIREKVLSNGGRVAYTAYGYHGCEVLIDGNYTWQSYTPYLQGWAKMQLEEIATKAWSQGINATVFNCPEIQTNSSALFLGVEISLYPLLAAMEREGGGEAANRLRSSCASLLKQGVTLEELLSAANSYLADPVLAGFRDYSTWPHHNNAEQAALMLNSATRMLEMNRDMKEIVCAELSRAVFRTVGQLKLRTSWKPGAPVFWLNHDIIARQLLAGN